MKHFSSYVNLIISLMSPFNDSCVSVIVHSSSKMATKYNSEILSAVMVWKWQSKVWLDLLTSLLMFSSPMDWHTALYTLVNKVNFSFTFVSTSYIRTTTMSQFFSGHQGHLPHHIRKTTIMSQFLRSSRTFATLVKNPSFLLLSSYSWEDLL